MTEENIIHSRNWVERIASNITRAAGSNITIIIAFSLVILWIITGPIFQFSTIWQMTMTSVTSLTTFLMVFLIQKSQNKDYLAIQIKLSELVSSHSVANNSIVNIENLSEDELKMIQKYYLNLGEKNRSTEILEETFSIEETIDPPK